MSDRGRPKQNEAQILSKLWTVAGSFCFLFVIVFLALASTSHACTVFCLKELKKTTTGYSMEWVGDVSSYTKYNELQPYEGGGVFTSASGTKKKSLLPESNFTWTSKHKSLTQGAFGPDFAFNGVNEEGLEVYLLGTPDLGIDNRNLPAISELDVISLLLDTAATTEEAIQIFKKVKIEHKLLPLHFYIKDAKGKVIIVDFKEGLRIHEPLPKQEFVTNKYFDTELEERAIGQADGRDNRHIIIQEEMKKNNKNIDSILGYVGDYANTLWSTSSVRTANSWLCTIKVNPLSPNPGFRKSMTLDMNEVFKRMPSEPHVIKMSEIDERKTGFRPLTNEELRLIQLVNFELVQENQVMLLGRNGKKTAESKNFLSGIIKKLKSQPIIQGVSSRGQSCGKILGLSK